MNNHFILNLQDYTRVHMIEQILHLCSPSTHTRARLEAMSWTELQAVWRKVLDSTVPDIRRN